MEGMKNAASSSVALPIVLEQIFKRFSNHGSVDQIDKENLLLDLHKLLGRRLVSTALHILDHQTIVIYTNSRKTIEVAEIVGAPSSFQYVRLFLHINYCTCGHFQEKVLIKDHTCTGPYTCQHVVALRLAVILQHKCLSYKEIPSHNLDLLLNSFIPTSSEEEI